MLVGVKVKISFLCILESSSTLRIDDVDGCTMIQHATLENNDKSKLVETTKNHNGNQASNNTIDVDLGTMVINNENDSTIQRQRPDFLNHFDEKEKEKNCVKSIRPENSANNGQNKPQSPIYGNIQAIQNETPPAYPFSGPGTGNKI